LADLNDAVTLHMVVLREQNNMAKLIIYGAAALLFFSAGNVRSQQAPTTARGRDHPAIPKSLSLNFADKDYPKAARRAGVSGRVKVLATIDPLGRVRECTIVTSSGNADLDAGTCQLVKRRGRFIPATDAQGRAVAGQFTTGVNWQLPDRRAASRVNQ
jgi:TonB family protein